MVPCNRSLVQLAVNGDSFQLCSTRVVIDEKHELLLFG